MEVNSASVSMPQMRSPQKSLSASQTAMKRKSDQHAALRNFQIGDKVLTLLPLSRSTLSAKFCCAKVCDRLSETDYLISTPERQKKTRVCHINMLKAYVTHNSTPIGTALMAAFAGDSALDDDVTHRSLDPQPAYLPNSEMLRLLPSRLEHLSQ